MGLCWDQVALMRNFLKGTLLSEISKAGENVTEKLNSRSLKLILAIILTCLVILRLAN